MLTSDVVQIQYHTDICLHWYFHDECIAYYEPGLTGYYHHQYLLDQCSKYSKSKNNWTLSVRIFYDSCSGRSKSRLTRA